MKPWRAPFPKFGEGPGLQRVRAVAQELGVELAQFGAQGAVIVGSNGKGSTAAMTAALLEQSGARVGLFTSPHLFDLNERFRLDGDDITDEALAIHWTRVLGAVDRAGVRGQLGAFEFLFLIAADFFTANECAHTVWEAGIGGRFDPVRLIEARRLALTSLDLEHTALLGNTIEDIARNKLDAAPGGALVFYGEACAPWRDVISVHCGVHGARTQFVPARADAPAGLVGAFQRQNAALACALAQHIKPLSAEQEQAGLAATRWPGRLEVIEREPLVVIDVGHTPAGVQAALDGFTEMRGDREAALVVGVSDDKDVGAIVSILAPAFSTIICAAARHKGAPASHVAAEAALANPGAEIIVAESLDDARRLALAKAARGAVYVAGGLFLAAEFKALHSGRDPASLVFF